MAEKIQPKERIHKPSAYSRLLNIRDNMDKNEKRSNRSNPDEPEKYVKNYDDYER